MIIKLVQTGGILPVKKESCTEVSWSETDLEIILSKIKVEGVANAPVRDGIGYLLEVNGNETAIDFTKVPKKHLPVFNELKKKLTVVKF